MGTVWLWFEGAAPYLLLFYTVVKALYELIKHWDKYRDWRNKRIKRKEMLDSIITNGPHIVCSKQLQDKHNNHFEELTEELSWLNDKFDNVEQKLDDKMSGLKETLDITISHNKRQDRKIEYSNMESKVIIESLIAIMDGLIQGGANGEVREAKSRLKKHLIDVSRNV